MDKTEQSVTSPKSWWVTLIVGILFGYLGVHRFYVGKVGTGLLYLFTAGIFGIGWVVDLVMVCCLAFTDNEGKVVRPQ